MVLGLGFIKDVLLKSSLVCICVWQLWPRFALSDVPSCERDVHLKGNMSYGIDDDDGDTQTRECLKPVWERTCTRSLPEVERELHRSGGLGASRPLR